MTNSSHSIPKTINLARFDAAPLEREPFDHVVVTDFIAADALGDIVAGFPVLEQGGSFPVESENCAPAFADFVSDLQGIEVAQAFSKKFAIDLTGRPTMVTLRGQSRKKDGRIHSDSKSKLITALIYLNRDWPDAAGRLRLLRGPDDIDDYADEIVPLAGSLVAFRCTEIAYHGYRSFVGARASLQLNWVTDETVLTRELSRHGVSAKLKKWTGLGG